MQAAVTVNRATRWLVVFTVMTGLAPAPAFGANQTLFDAHLHYSAADADRLDPAAVIAILDRNDISRAVVTGTPARHVVDLYRQAPTRIVPFLGVYRQPADKATWHRDTGLPARVGARLASGPWRGIGELHLFAADRHSPVFRRIVDLAVQHELPLLLHCDPAVIDSLYEYSPAVTVIWAHGGAYPWPPLIRDYLERYPGLYVDLSVREDRIAPEGVMDPGWTTLLMEHAGRFLVGVDTFSTRRWQQFDEVARDIRRWLAQLPEDVAERIARRNAETLFAKGIRSRSD
jgi:predicted TIM-barrel fold metal-dependent hydrolase